MGRTKLVNQARAELKRSQWLRERGRVEEAEAAITRAGDLYDKAGFRSTADAIYRGEIN